MVSQSWLSYVTHGGQLWVDYARSQMTDWRVTGAPQVSSMKSPIFCRLTWPCSHCGCQNRKANQPKSSNIILPPLVFPDPPHHERAEAGPSSVTIWAASLLL